MICHAHFRCHRPAVLARAPGRHRDTLSPTKNSALALVQTMPSMTPNTPLQAVISRSYCSGHPG